MLYSAYQSLVIPARARAEIWRLLLGFVLIAAVFYLISQAYFWLVRTAIGPSEWEGLGQELIQGSSPRAVVAMLFNYIALTLALAIVLPLLHQRGLGSLTGKLSEVARDFAKVLVVLLALNVAYWVLPWPGKVNPVLHLDPSVWLRWLPVALVALLVQTSAEELLFRGYVQSQLAAKFKSSLIWLLFPSLVFAALHYDPGTFGQNAPWVALWAGLFAFAAADVTARAGNLGPAIAMHFVNNAGAILINGVSGNFDGLALQTLPLDPTNVLEFRGIIIAEAALILFTWLLTRLAIRR